MHFRLPHAAGRRSPMQAPTRQRTAAQRSRSAAAHSLCSRRCCSRTRNPRCCSSLTQRSQVCCQSSESFSPSSCSTKLSSVYIDSFSLSLKPWVSSSISRSSANTCYCVSSALNSASICAAHSLKRFEHSGISSHSRTRCRLCPKMTSSYDSVSSPTSSSSRCWLAWLLSEARLYLQEVFPLPPLCHPMGVSHQFSFPSIVYAAVCLCHPQGLQDFFLLHHG